MKNRPDTQEGVNELKLLLHGERILWLRESAQLKRNMTIYPETLTAQQRQRLAEIEKEMLDMAHDASEETRTRTVLKGE